MGAYVCAYVCVRIQNYLFWLSGLCNSLIILLNIVNEAVFFLMVLRMGQKKSKMPGDGWSKKSRSLRPVHIFPKAQQGENLTWQRSEELALLCSYWFPETLVLFSIFPEGCSLPAFFIVPPLLLSSTPAQCLGPCLCFVISTRPDHRHS